MILENRESIQVMLDGIAELHDTKFYFGSHLDVARFPGIYKSEFVCLNYEAGKTGCTLYVHEPERLPPNESINQRSWMTELMKQYFPSKFSQEIFDPPMTPIRIDPSFELHHEPDDLVRIELSVWHDNQQFQKQYIEQIVRFAEVSPENKNLLSQIVSFFCKHRSEEDEYPIYHSALLFDARRENIERCKLYIHPFVKSLPPLCLQLQTVEQMFAQINHKCPDFVGDFHRLISAHIDYASIAIIGVDLNQDTHDFKIYYEIHDIGSDYKNFISNLFPGKEEMLLETQRRFARERFFLHYIGVGQKQGIPIIKMYYFKDC